MCHNSCTRHQPKIRFVQNTGQGFSIFYFSIFATWTAHVCDICQGDLRTCRHCRQSTWGGTHVQEQRPPLLWWSCHSGRSVCHTSVGSQQYRCTLPSSGRSQIAPDHSYTLWRENKNGRLKSKYIWINVEISLILYFCMQVCTCFLFSLCVCLSSHMAAKEVIQFQTAVSQFVLMEI